MPLPSLRQASYLVLLFVGWLLLVPCAGYEADLEYWVRWARYNSEHGLGNAYQEPTNNYNPLYQYVLWGFGHLAGSAENIFHYRHSLKVFTLLFDFAGAYWAASLVSERKRRFGLLLLLLLNIGYLYNSLVWVQVDAIYTFFAFGAVVLAVQRKAVGSGVLFVLALAAKTQAIIFLPPLLLLWVPLWVPRPKLLVQTMAAGTAVATLLLAPFIWGGEQNDLPRILGINLGATETYPQLVMGATNFWELFFKGSTSDTLPFAGLSYRSWGLLLFCGFSSVALLPLLLRAVQRLQAPARPARQPAATDPDMALALLSLGLIPLLFCFFNTQMHERYWHAAVLFLAAYGFVRRDYLLYVIVSLAYFLNLETVLDYFRGQLGLMDQHFFFLKSWFPAVLFAVSIGVGLTRLYRLTPWPAGWRGAAATGTDLPLVVPAAERNSGAR